MRKRLSSKLLAVILTLAICATTVLGCLMTVSAEDVNANVFFSAGETPDKTDLTKATIELTINLPDDLASNYSGTEEGEIYGGIAAATVDLTCSSDLTLNNVSVVKGTKVDGSDYASGVDEIEIYSSKSDPNDFTVETDLETKIHYTSLTFKLTFDVKGAKDGEKFSVKASSVKISNHLADREDELVNAATETGIIVAGCEHELAVDEADLVYTDTVNGYAVYSNSQCQGDCKNYFGPQVVPTKLPGKTIYWDNREIATSLDSFEKDGDVYIINKVSELAYISSALPEVTTGKKFKVADGIGKIVLQSKTYGDAIIALDSADAVKDYFSANSSSMYQWVSNQYYEPGRMCFAGSFDGNGAEIYGMLSTGTSVGGLFGIVDSATITNLALKNSYTYLTGKGSGSDRANFQFGLLASYGVDYDNDADKDIIYFDGCTIANNYIYKYVNQNSYNNGWTGLVFGASGTSPYVMQNMLIYGNSFTSYAEHLDTEYYPGISGVTSHPAATEEYKTAHPTWVSSDGYMTTVLENSIVLDSPILATTLDGTTLILDAKQWLTLSVVGSYNDCYENVYTDWDVSKITDNGNFKKAQFLSRGGHIVSKSDIKGADAATAEKVMPNLDWVNAWEIDVNRGYPRPIQPVSDNVSELSTFELTLVGTNVTYNNGGDYNYNFYYHPDSLGSNYDTEDIYLYVAQLGENDATGSFHRLEGRVLSADEAAAIAADELQEGDICFTIKRISAREIHNTMLATAVVKGGNALWGDTAELSVAKYVDAIINGDYDTADKNVAQAVRKYGNAAATALNTKNDIVTGTTIHWNGGTDSDLTNEVHEGNTQAGDEANPIIIDSAEELAYLVQAPTDETKGKYYKVADGISNIVLQKEEHDNGIMQLSSQSEVETYFENHPKTNWVYNYNYNEKRTKAFYGNFDGNGVTIYGLYGPGGGYSLFGELIAPAVIKNFAVKNSMMSLSNFGSIISSRLSLIDETAEERDKNNPFTFENIEISNCRMEATNVANKNVGLLTGEHQSGANVTVNNLLVYGCEIFNTTDSTVCTRLSGMTGWNNAATGIKNSVVLDCSITEPLNGTDSGKEIYNYVRSGHTVENVYSSYAADAQRAQIYGKTITYITNEQAMGIGAIENMPGLDWNGTWCYGETYPSLAKGTYNTSSEGKTIYWDNREIATSLDSFEKDGDVYIINKVSELAYISSALPAVTTGKKFKVADGIDKIVLQSKTYGDAIIALDSVDVVRDYFSANSSSMYQWVSNTYYESGKMCFAGSFDGNGAEIYGMLSTGTSVGGLFGIVDSATITNLALKNSYTYLEGNRANFQFGLLASYGVEADNTTINDNVIYFNHCEISNNYIHRNVNQTSYENGWTGLVFGSSRNGPCIMQNMLIYGNSFTSYAEHLETEYYPGIIGNAKKPQASAEYIAAHPRWVSGDSTPYMTTVLENSIVLDSPILATTLDGTTLILDAKQWLALSVTGKVNDCYENVYTDWDVSKITDNGNFKKAEFLSRGGHIVSESDLIGNAAQSIVDIFNADNAANGNSAVWYTGKGTMLGFTPTAEMLPEAQAAYDAITFTSANCDNYGDSDLEFGIYATSLNLKTNPYISFVFAFNGDYKRDRQNIEVTFNYEGGSKTVKVEENGALVDGWANAKNAGRYHTYRLQDIPVKALCSPITVTVTYNGEEKVKDTSFSLQGFGYELVTAYNKAPSEYYATRIEAVKAILFYTQMIEARYGDAASNETNQYPLQKPTAVPVQ